MKKWKSLFNKKLQEMHFDIFKQHDKKKIITIEFIDVGSGLHNTSIWLNNKLIVAGIFDEDDVGKIEKALEMIDSVIEKK